MILHFFAKIEAYIELGMLWVLFITLEKGTIVFEKVYLFFKK